MKETCLRLLNRKWPEHVTIKEVGPRDGLQNEKRILSSQHKIAWIDSLSTTGLSYIEATSFVHPKWIPQLSDHIDVAKQIKRNPDITYAALVPNIKGLKAALHAEMDEISVFISASETHNQKNINKSIAETFPVISEVVKESLKHNKKVRGYLSTAFICPFEGAVDPKRVLEMCDKLFDLGIYEISLGDTTGAASPKQVEELLEIAVLKYGSNKLALHFHNTFGMGLANVLTALEYGIATFDSSLGGLGGCPYAPGASGNIATDDLVHMLEKMNIQTGVNHKKLLQSAVLLQQLLNKPLGSHQMSIYNRNKC
jgi:hydroxymethylglutaryl-CoA lyase